MFKKLKQNFHFNIIQLKPVLIFIIGIAFLLPYLAVAQTPSTPTSPNYKSGGITITTDLLVNGQKDNYVKVVKGQPIQFSAVFTFGNFVDDAGASHNQLTLNKDTFDVQTSTVLDGNKRPINQIGAGLDAVGSNNSCTGKTIFSTIVVGSTAQLMTCSFIGGKNLISANPIVANTAYTVSLSMSSDDAKLTQLGLNKPCGNGGGATPCLAVYPYVTIGLVAGKNVDIAVDKAEKDIYIQTFNTQAELDAAKRPTDVPGYGSNTGTVNSDKSGNALLDLVNRLIGALLGLIQEFIYAVFFWVVAPVIQSMLSIQAYKDTFVAVIYPGWEVIRNLCNIFFIMALIIIAMATLFRVESYKFKDLIIQLIIAALLVNFSLVIGQAVLGLADTVQAQFLPANVTVIRSLAGDLMVNAYRQDVYKSDFGTQGSFSSTVKPIFLLAMSLGSFAVFCAIAVFLVIRIIALWLLLMVSPVAYAVAVLPATAEYRKKWWTEFLHYAFFTPIMAFFLNMAAIISNASQKLPILQSVGADSLSKDLGNDGLAVFVFKVASNILLLVFLLVALKVAEQAGIYGADGVTKLAKQGIYAPFGAAGFLGKAAGNKIKKEYDKATSEWANKGGWRQQAFKVAHAPSFIKSLREESKKERELYKARVEAGATEVARKQYGWRRKTESPMFLFDEHKGKELYEEEEGEWSDNEQIVIGIGNRLVKEAEKGDLRAQIKLKHWFTEAFRHRNLNEAMEGDNGLAKNFLNGKLNYNSNNIRYFFQALKDKGIIDENFTAEFLKKLSKDGYETGDFNGVELVYNDPKTNHPHMIKMEKPVNGDAMPVGWDHYIEERQRLIDEADKVGREAAKKKYGVVKDAEGKVDVDEEGNEKINATDEQIGVIISNTLKTKEDEFAAHDHDYSNSMHADRAKMYMKINMSKKTGTDQVKMFHDSILNVGVEDGDVRISDAGEEVIGMMDAGKMYAMGRDNMPKKTRDKFMAYIDKVKQDETVGLGRIHDDLEKVIRARYRVSGIKVSDTKVEQEIDEQTNLWLAAGYSIKSSQPGASVLKQFFEAKPPTGSDGKPLPGVKPKAKTQVGIRSDIIEALKLYDNKHGPSPTDTDGGGG